MTEKRFELKWRDTGEVLYDNETGLEHGIYSPDYRFHVRDMMNEFDKENKELKKQMNRLYNYFMDWHSDETGGNQFSEMWDMVKEDERWDCE